MRLLLSTLLVLTLGAVAPATARGQYRVVQFSASNGLPQNTVTGIAQARDGYLWFSTFDGLVRYDGVTFTIFDRANAPEMRRTQFGTISIDTAGALWATTQSGVFRIRGSAFDWVEPVAGKNALTLANYPGFVARPSPAFDTTGIADTSVLLAGDDRDHSRWFYSPTALYRRRDGVLTRFDARTFLHTDRIRVAFADREGTLWVGSDANGLFRVTRQFLTTYSVDEGLFERNVYPVMQDRAGRIWMGGGRAITIKDGATFRSWIVGRDDRTHFRLFAPGTGRAKDSVLVRSFYEDRAGRTWVGVADALLEVKDGRILSTRFLGFGFNDAIIEDGEGTFWVGSPRGVIRLHGDSVHRYEQGEGFPNSHVNVLHLDRRGTLWAGTRNGLVRRDGAKWTVFTVKDGLAGDNIRSIFEDSDGTLWIGTFDSGISRYRDGRFVSITATAGLFSNGAFHILDDARGQFWISSNRGLYRVSREQLNGFADGRIARIRSVSYGTAEGMRTAEANGERQPAGVKATDGTLWFPTADGVVVVDPTNIEFNNQPPLVTIDRIMVDGHAVVLGSRVRLTPGQTDLEIGYTAPSSVQAKDTHFRYRLDADNAGWTEAGTVRQVHFSHLPPGEYAFRVIAANSDGVWSKTGAQLTIEVVPYVWQTTWFRLVVACLVVAGGISAYVVRVRGLKAQEQHLTALVAERTAALRIANDQLQQLAIEDALTGLANRRRFEEFLEQEWRRSQRTGSAVSALMLDVDFFKRYNDALGHQAGDACLRAVATAIRSAVPRATDLVARYGGEEFAVILVDSSPETARAVAHDIRDAVRALQLPHPDSEVRPTISISIGTATRPGNGGGTSAELVAEADARLYEAKAGGRDRVVPG